MGLRPILTLLGILFTALQTAAGQDNIYVNAQLPWHPVVLDAQGKLLAWYRPETNLGYDQFLRLDWDFLEHRAPVDKATGLKLFLVAPIYDERTLEGIGWQHNPPSIYSHVVDMLVGWLPYAADREAIQVVAEMLDYQLAHGTTSGDWNWAGVPFSTSCRGDKDYGRCLMGMPRAFFGGIEPDKVGEMGLAYVLFYELTGERRFLDAGLRCADQLAKHIRPGDASHTPWPFRIDGRTGAVIAGEEFGGLVVAPVRLFDELIRSGLGDQALYRRARDLAWNWILNQPLNKNSPAWDKWTGYYEDVPKDTVNVNDMDSMMTAYYILSRSDPATVDPAWKAHVGYLLDRSRVLLGRGPYFGAWAIDEQMRPDGAVAGASAADLEGRPTPALLGTQGKGCCSRAGMSCRTAQWGAVNAMYYEKTGDGQARENAFRSLNYATYFALPDGKIACCGADYHTPFWFEDGYADAGRSFMWALGAVPEFAPDGQNHLLRSSSVVQRIEYRASAIHYETFHKEATEVLRLTFEPVRITCAGTPLGSVKDLETEEGYQVRKLPQGDFVVRVHHLRSGVVGIE